jgi:hypothetical protein
MLALEFPTQATAQFDRNWQVKMLPRIALGALLPVLAGSSSDSSAISMTETLGAAGVDPEQVLAFFFAGAAVSR